MRVDHFFCDVCKKEVNESKDLQTITVGNGGDFNSYSSYNHFVVYKKYDLCEECRIKLGINLKKETPQEELKSIESRLFDIVAEIVTIVNGG